MSKFIADKIRESAAQAALSAFQTHAKGNVPLDLAILKEIKVCGRVPAIRAQMRDELVAHYRSQVGKAEIVKAPPDKQNLTPEEIADMLMKEFPEM